MPTINQCTAGIYKSHALHKQPCHIFGNFLQSFCPCLWGRKHIVVAFWLLERDQAEVVVDVEDGCRHDCQCQSMILPDATSSSLSYLCVGRCHLDDTPHISVSGILVCRSHRHRLRQCFHLVFGVPLLRFPGSAISIVFPHTLFSSLYMSAPSQPRLSTSPT